MEGIDHPHAIRADAWDEALAEIEVTRREAARPGFYGSLVLTLQDGFVENVRFERIKRMKRPATKRRAAA